MTKQLRDTWSELICDPGPAPSDIRMRLVFIDEDGEVRLFAAVTARERLPAFLLELPNAVRPRNFKTLVTRAFQLSAPPMDGLPYGRWALFIELKDSAFQDLFEVLASDVLTAIQSAPGAEATLQAALRCIDRWRRFVERRGEPLSDEEVQGLIGELVVLCRCAGRFGAKVALEAWTGPDRALRDFELPDSSLEVKTYQGEDAATVLISSPDQLDAVALRPVYLVAVRLTASDAQGFTLSEFVRRTSSVLGADMEADVFEERLAASGYLATHAPLYIRRFIAGPVMAYAVTPGFPRIRSIDVPQGVLGVRFALSIPALAPFQAVAAAIIGDRVSESEGV